MDIQLDSDYSLHILYTWKIYLIWQQICQYRSIIVLFSTVRAIIIRFLKFFNYFWELFFKFILPAEDLSFSRGSSSWMDWKVIPLPFLSSLYDIVCKELNNSSYLLNSCTIPSLRWWMFLFRCQHWNIHEHIAHRCSGGNIHPRWGEWDRWTQTGEKRCST